MRFNTINAEISKRFDNKFMTRNLRGYRKMAQNGQKLPLWMPMQGTLDDIWWTMTRLKTGLKFRRK